MTNTPESLLTRFEIPIILAISVLLIAAAAVNQGLWQAATSVPFTAAIVAVSFALGAAVTYRGRWP